MRGNCQEVKLHNENHEGIQTMQVQKLFEDELASRGVAWSIDAASGRHAIDLERALSEATLETSDVDGVGLGFISTSLPFKAALLLAPNLKKVMEERLGWPLLAVAPDRDFVDQWAARHTEFAGRLGEIVVREHAAAPYPISTEIFELSDQGARAIGAFSSPA